MSGATGISQAHRDQRSAEIAAALRTEWRMIASVSLRPSQDGTGLAADFRLDPIVINGSLEQQGYPCTPEALAKIETRRWAALDDCVRRVNARLSQSERIKDFTVRG